jgi:dihydrodipicolinate reductase
MEGVRQEREAAHQRMHSVRPGDSKGPDRVIFGQYLQSSLKKEHEDINIEVDMTGVWRRRGWLK